VTDFSHTGASPQPSGSTRTGTVTAVPVFSVRITGNA
jgi:hypothetical protein